MKIVSVAAGSDEWRQARIGIPTASQAHRIVTPKAAPSSQRDGYMHELIAERMLGTWLGHDAGDFAERGNLLEPEAIAFYEFQSDADTISGGFCTTDDARIGCSPDRLILANGEPVGGLEIKCPKPSTHVGYLLNASHEGKYLCQVQCSLFVTGLQWWDLLSYHPDLPPALIRVKRDEPFIRLLGDRLREFCGELDAQAAKLEALKRPQAIATDEAR